MLAKHNVKWQQIGAVMVLITVLLFGVLSISFLGQAEEDADSTWVEVFSDSFDSLNTDNWTVTEWTDTGYEWGVTAYTRDSAPDSGLWAVGGGTQGSLLDWETDTYPEEVLVTLAIAGPFTPTQNLSNVRLSFDALNKVSDPDDTVTYFISYDGTNPVPGTEQTLAADTETWQAISWSPAAVENRPIWIGFRFFNDGADVHTGPLIDNLLLEFEYVSNIYMPYVALQPTLTPTPIPVFYDDFSDPQSGWFVGDAWRYNYWDYDRDGIKEGYWQIVANMNYVDGHYQIYLPLTIHGGGAVDTWKVWPAEKAPLPSDFYVAPDVLPDNYCIEVRAKLINEGTATWWEHWGVVFGANADRTNIYVLQVNSNHDFSVLQYPDYHYPGNQPTLGPIDLDEEIPLVGWTGLDFGTLITSFDYNTLRVVVKGDQVSMYINDWRLDQIYHKAPAVLTLPDMPRAWVGVIGGSWETTPVDIRFDYFEFTSDPAICPELQ